MKQIILTVLALLFVAAPTHAQLTTLGSGEPLDAKLGYHNPNTTSVLELLNGSVTGAAASVTPTFNSQVHSRPNSTGGLTTYDHGFFTYRRGTNAANDGSSPAHTGLVAGIWSGSTARPQGDRYHDAIAFTGIAKAAIGSTAAIFPINATGFLHSQVGFLTGIEIDVHNATGQMAPPLADSALDGTIKGLAVVGRATGTGSLRNSAAITIETGSGYDGAFRTGFEIRANAVSDVGVNLSKAGTGSSMAMPLLLGDNTYIWSLDTVGSGGAHRMIGQLSPTEIRMAPDGQNVQIGLVSTTDVGGAQFSVSTSSTTNAGIAIRKDGNSWWKFETTNGADARIRSNIASSVLHFTSGGDVSISTQGRGLILKATDGANCFRLTVNNAGLLTATGIACP